MDFRTTEIKNILKGIEDTGFVRKINCKYRKFKDKANQSTITDIYNLCRSVLNCFSGFLNFKYLFSPYYAKATL